jgi:signal transduction histidine kinase
VNILNDALEELKVGEAQITHGELASVYADKRQMVYLLKELVLNAIKYRRDDEPPRIHVDAREENGRWVFWVRDNGVGIDETHQQDVFTLFHRLRGNLEAGATGMGLAIAKRIVQQHGGDIWFESKLGQGTTFYFSIPDSTAHEHH